MKRLLTWALFAATLFSGSSYWAFRTSQNDPQMHDATEHWEGSIP